MSLPPDNQAHCATPQTAEDRWFTEEVYRHDASLKGYLRGSFPSVRDVEDVVQESYLRVWRRQVERPIESVKGFLFKVARHLALDLIRHNRASPFNDITDLAELSVMDNKPGVADMACTNQEISLLLEAIDSLPARCREIVILRKIQGMSQKEIASTLGLSEQTVQVQASRGLRRCEKYLRQHGVIRDSRP